MEYDDEDRLFFGRVVNIKDIIVFDGLSVDELEQTFHQVIDEYLANCQALNKTPEKTISQLSSSISAE
ncbi:MAG: type II toxin-antitoxin system HicB family antitoxin [Microcystaceae cyanobacterium]